MSAKSTTATAPTTAPAPVTIGGFPVEEDGSIFLPISLKAETVSVDNHCKNFGRIKAEAPFAVPTVDGESVRGVVARMVSGGAGLPAIWKSLKVSPFCAYLPGTAKAISDAGGNGNGSLRGEGGGRTRGVLHITKADAATVAAVARLRKPSDHVRADIAAGTITYSNRTQTLASVALMVRVGSAEQGGLLATWVKAQSALVGGN